MSRRLLLSALVMVFCAGCSTLVPLTADLRETYDLDSEDLANLQYFTSGPILLDKTDETEGFNIQHHLIVDGAKTRSQGIWLDRHTPGVPTHVSADGDFIKVRFEPPCMKPVADTLGFANRHTDRYRLAAKDVVADTPVVVYENVSYEADSESWQTHLLVDLKEIRQLKKHRRRLPGTYFCEYPAPAIVRPFIKFENPAPDIED